MITPTILLTGITEHVGAEVARYFMRVGLPIRIGINTIQNTEYFRSPRVDLREFHYNNHQSITDLFDGIETVFLCTPLAENLSALEATMVDEAKKQGVKKIVKLSVMGASLESSLTLLRTHKQVERYIESSKVSYTFIRPNFLMQDFITYQAAMIKTNNNIVVPIPEAPISYVDARDVATVICKIITDDEGHDSKAYTLTGPQTLSFANVAEVFSQILQRDITISVSEEQYKRILISQGTIEWMTKLFQELYMAASEDGKFGDVTTVIQEITGIQPHTFSDFVKDTALYYS
jgi:uncharacterized protein YbjT (DUF2867 family)